jgi:pimeloyl-ACP methyl ester carboxylesterase
MMLSRKYEVIAIDNRGAGRSDKPYVPYSIEMMAGDTAGILDTLKVKNANILGLSMGGRIAVALALSRPELVKSLVLVSTRMGRAERRGWRSRLRLNVSLRFRARGSEKYPQRFYAFKRQWEASGDYDATARLCEIHVPTLILHGNDDKLVPYKFAQEINEGIEGSKIINFEGEHLFFIGHFREFIEAIFEFLGSVK